MGSWGYGQSLMKRATNLGLIERQVKKEKSPGRGKPRIYNSLTNKGREVIGLLIKSYTQSNCLEKTSYLL